MNQNNVEGGVKAGVGEIESAGGELLDRPDMQARGDARRLEGKAQDVIGTVQDAVTQAADEVSAAASKAGDQARTAYGQVTDRAQKIAAQVDPFVKDQPYVALGLAAATGLLIGLLIAGRGPKIIYVRPRD